MWTERYRPKTLDDVKTEKSKVLLTSIQEDPTSLPHLLLYGPPGTGKTSTALAIANQIYDKADQPFWVKILNASDQRGIDVVRGPVTDFCETVGLRTTKKSYPFKLLIFDEADAMTPDAQKDLRPKIIEHSGSVRFCFIANYLSKMHDAIQSRCTLIRFPPVPRHLVEAQVARVAKGEDLALSPDIATIIVNEAKGDLRKATHILQALESVTRLPLENQAEEAWKTLGKPTEETIERVRVSLKGASPKDRLVIWKSNLGRFLLIDILKVYAGMIKEDFEKIPKVAEMEQRLLQEGGTCMPAHRAALMGLIVK